MVDRSTQRADSHDTSATSLEATPAAIAGATVEEIVASIRSLIDEGSLRPGDSLPPMRGLAETLGVNRNTASAAYRTLTQAGLAETRRPRWHLRYRPLRERRRGGLCPRHRTQRRRKR